MEGPLDQVASWPVRTAAVAVISPAGLVAARGPLDRPFSWASVTKLLTALAALDAVQRGLLDLDEPLAPGSHHPAPARARFRARAARRQGPQQAGAAAHLLQPRHRDRRASHRGARRQALRAVAGGGDLQAARAAAHPPGRSPSWGAAGPLGDLAALGSELLSPSLVDSELLAEATRTAFPGLPGVVPGFGRQPLCDWGLGFEIRDSKAPHWTGSRNSPATFGHFGRSGSFLWVDPEAGGSLRRPHRPGLRSLGGAGLAAPFRRHPHLLRQRVTGRGRPGAAGRQCGPPAPLTCGGAAPGRADAGSRD